MKIGTKRCVYCNASLSEEASFCPECGQAVAASAPPLIQPEASGLSLIRFSPRIGDPKFNKYKRDSKSWSLIFAGILAVIAVIGFPIYGRMSGEIDMPNSLYYGLGIGGMFVAIALLQTLKRALDTTWDGTVVDKKLYRRTTFDRNTNHRYHYVYYVLKVKKDGGGVRKSSWKNTDGIYNYYTVGDRVRHHKGLFYYEKFDKSKDTQILCPACLAMNDIGEELCARCKCPLLK